MSINIINNTIAEDPQSFRADLTREKQTGNVKYKMQKEIDKLKDQIQEKMAAKGQPINAQIAYILAVTVMFQGNEDQMSNLAGQMQGLTAPMNDINKSLQDIENQEKGIANLSPADGAVASATINQQTTSCEMQISVLGTRGQQESTELSYLSSQNNAQSGIAQLVLDVMEKTNVTRPG